MKNVILKVAYLDMRNTNVCVCYVYNGTLHLTVAPGPPEVRAMCVVVIWRVPQSPNGIITGYQIEIKREGTNGVKIISKSESDRFYEIDTDDLPDGNGKVSFRVSQSTIL